MATRVQNPDLRVLTDNQQRVNDVADAIYRLPANFTDSYAAKVRRAAAYLKSDPTIAAPPTRPMWFGPPDTGLPWLNNRSPVMDGENGADRNATMILRRAVVEVIDSVNSFASRAKQAGFSPPSNPFTRIVELNAARTKVTLVPDFGGRMRPVTSEDPAIDVSAEEADDIVTSIDVFLKLLKEETDGVIDLRKGSVAQLSSVSVSFEGFGGSGDNAADIMRFLPDMDAIKEQRARDALSVLDFKKRVPKVMLTMDYVPDDELRGSVIVWKKIPDASGYVVRRRNAFNGEERSWTLPNQRLDDVYSSLRQYVTDWGLSFYETVDPRSVYCYLDGETARDAYYVYTVQAYQLANPDAGTVFAVESSPYAMSVAQRLQVRDRLEAIDPGAGPDTISPWPVIAESLLGSSEYDWMLAGVNTFASVARKDDRTETRKYSYLAAQLDVIFAQMDSGKFVTPRDVNEIAKNVRVAIGQFGVSQVIEEVLKMTGALFYFEGKDVQEDPHFKKIGSVDPQASDIIGTIAAAIDPETATLDLSTLASNLPGLLTGAGNLSPGTKLLPGTDPFVQARPTEIEVPNHDSPTAVDSEDRLQSVQNVSGQDTSHADLTTFDGISALMKTLRIISDIGPNRRAPADTSVKKLSVDNSNVDSFVGPVTETVVDPQSRPGVSNPVSGMITQFIADPQSRRK